jgi:ABC-2 type transport system permease protein
VAVPFVTMGLLAEERRSGSIEMLMTAPVRDWEVVVGKYIGVAVYMLCLMVPSLLQIVVVRSYGMPEWGPVLSGYVGLALFLVMHLAMGLFFSAVSKNVIVAVMLSCATFVTLMLLGVVVDGFPAIGEEGSLIFNAAHYLAAFLQYASTFDHLFAFLKGTVNTRDVAYFASTTVFFLFLSSLALESRKWK